MDQNPALETVRAAIELACRAPSVHNTQPWRWLLGERSIHLMADRTRQVPVTDPDGRDLLISCGAVLHHLRVALAGCGWASTVRYLPNPADRDHLAAVTVEPCTPTPDDIELSAAMTRRRSDRRRSAPWSVPAQHLDLLVAVAERAAPVRLVPVRDRQARIELARVMADTAALQEADPGYRTELAVWSGRSHGAREGVLADSAPAGPAVHGDTVMRAFAGGTLPVDGSGAEDDLGELLVVATTADEPRNRLHAGEAASALMLTATVLNLATCPLSQATELPASRASMTDRVLGWDAVAQLVIRVAWAPVEAGPLPYSPRRPLGDVLAFLPGATPRRGGRRLR